MSNAPTRPLIAWPDLATLPRDLTAGLVVFLVALPLCLGVALTSGTEPFAGLLAGIVGGIVIGLLSGSHTSVSGPSPGLAAVVVAQIALLGSFPAFLLAVVLAGLIQIGLGIARVGFLATFFPNSVIKGLLAAIGVILILKQIPHVLGIDLDPEGDMAFQQADNQNTLSELGKLVGGIEPGAAALGLVSIAVLVVWGKWKLLKHVPIPAPLVVVLLGVGANLLFRLLGEPWNLGPSHLVKVPVASNMAAFFKSFQVPDFAQLSKPAVYTAALTIAAVASLETLLNLGAADRIDPQQRTSAPSRELLAQGIGNIVVGLIGGIPISSAIVRSTVNVNAGSKTKLATIFHGVLLLVSVLLLPVYLNLIPLSCLGAILLVTGAKLINPALLKQMWNEGRYQFVPFAVTVVAIVFTDLLIGILIGLAVSISFILHSNMRRPIRRVMEKHLGGDVLHLELANQVSFLNRAALSKVFDEIPQGGHVLLNAQNTDYIDPDVLDLIRDFKEQKAPARGVEVSLLGFQPSYKLIDQIQYVDYSTRKLQTMTTPQMVLQILKDGHERFRTGRRLTRDFGRQVIATAQGQHPLAVVLSCIDSRTPAELIFDLGVGDIFSVRLAGNISSRKVLGSVEYGCAVSGAKLVLVLGHTRCGAVTAAVNLFCSGETAAKATGCDHLDYVIQDVQQAVDQTACQRIDQLTAVEKETLVNGVARRNVLRIVAGMRQQSQTLDRLVQEGRIAVVGAMYDVVDGNIEFMTGAENNDLLT